MTKYMNPGYQDPNSYDVGVAIPKVKVKELQTETVVWFDRYGNELFTSRPVKTTGGIGYYADLSTVPHETTRLPFRIELESIEALMLLSGLLDKMMRDAGY
ncbi:hypothetical protein HJB53_30315 [Rhizobium lentis]|uniref:hypothetical protein n=1 Tax=Rhizobium lentis TaxID=1138194 RepID=UPI001C839C47|nr:hypothetical protein [Rhizobium lentis]MBX5130787.1 hypothetical protein [Rhizobium lentis]